MLAIVRRARMSLERKRNQGSAFGNCGCAAGLPQSFAVAPKRRSISGCALPGLVISKIGGLLNATGRTRLHRRLWRGYENVMHHSFLSLLCEGIGAAGCCRFGDVA